MAAVNSIISKDDYNGIRNKLVNVMGTGQADYGWGQNTKILSSAVTESDRVSMNDWGKLRYDIINAYVHIYGSQPTVAKVDEGYTIRYSNTFVPDTGQSPGTPTYTDAPVTQYDTWVNNIVSNRFTVGTGQFSTSSPVTNFRTWNSGTSPTSWTSKITCEVKVEFATANEARYFFNSGGQVRILSSRDNPSGSLGTDQALKWTNLLSSAGTRSFGGNLPSSSINWYRLTSSDQSWYSLNGSSPYGSNVYRINARCDVSNNSNGSGRIGYFLVEFLDNYTDPGTPAPEDNVDGTFRVFASLSYADGNFIPTGTGPFSVTLPTVTVGNFLQIA